MPTVRSLERHTCHWCNQGHGKDPVMATVVKAYPDSPHTDGPFTVCVPKCLQLAKHFGYTIVTQTSETVGGN